MRTGFKYRIRSVGYNFEATAFSRLLHSGDTYTNCGSLTLAPEELEFFIKKLSSDISFEASDERSKDFLLDHCAFKLKNDE